MRKNKTKKDRANLDFEHLSVAERILLVQRIWDSIADEQHEIELTEAQKREIDRRLERMKKHPGQGSSWEDVKRRVRKRAKQ